MTWNNWAFMITVDTEHMHTPDWVTYKLHAANFRTSGTVFNQVETRCWILIWSRY